MGVTLLRAVPAEELFIALVYDPDVVSEDVKNQIIEKILTKAGFPVVKIERGELYDYHYDQDGSAYGKYVANAVSGYKIIERREGNVRASYWLNEIWDRLKSPMFGDLNERRQFLTKEIERSVPLKPIVLTTFGETLREDPPDIGLVDHTRDDRRLNDCVGVHDVCDCSMDLKRVSETHKAIVCRGCYLRVVIPNHIETYGQLRACFRDLQSHQPEPQWEAAS